MSENRYAERDDPRFVLDPPQRAHLEGVVATLEFLTHDWLENDGDIEYLKGALDMIQHGPSEWTCCPLCQEVECDSDCPLLPLRDNAGHWVGSSGAWKWAAKVVTPLEPKGLCR